ncbi:MAG: glycosyltransferase [Clostridium sp.]|nr:glycosyltransferase [Clostridium sp.]
MNIAVIGGNGKYSMESSLSNALVAKGQVSRVFDIYNHWFYTSKSIKKYTVPTDQFVRKSIEAYDRKSWLHLAHEVERMSPDLVICIDRRIHPVFVSALKKTYRKIIHINPDSFYTLGAQQVFASDYDAWFVKDAYMLRFMKDNMKLNAFMYNEVTDVRLSPKPQEPKYVVEEKIGVDVMTYGTLYPYRTRILKLIADAGISIKLYGTVPHRFFDKSLSDAFTGEFILGARRAEVIYGSKIALNTLHFAEVEAVNARFYQINGSGGFQLCDYRPMLKDVLPVDPELVSYKTTDECIEKIKYYLAHPQERYEIAEKIYQYSVEHFSFENLAQYILGVVEEL